MRKFMEQPEVQAKMDQVRKQENDLTDRSYTMVFKALDRGQASTFRKMLGKKFDLDLIRPGRRPRGNDAASNATAQSKTQTTKAEADDAADDSTAKPGAQESKATEGAAAKRSTTANDSAKPAAPKAAVKRRGSR
jgi:hypothetical protein